MPKVRVEIPTNPSELLKLAESIKARHDDLAAASPLKGLDWAQVAPKIAQASQLDDQSSTLHRDAEKAREARDVLIPSVTEFVRSSRDVLLGLNRSNPRALGDFGFGVNDSTASPAKKNGNGQPSNN
jgi:hypothetical protein